jgi:hypothetical protein
MLNLLIAIISDTFERVIERKAAQFNKEQVEYEFLFLTCYGLSSPCDLHLKFK